MFDRIVFCFTIVFLNSANAALPEPFGFSAMTTVLARPLGGYGLTPLVFEPSPNFVGMSSNSIETKVRKDQPRSAVFEMIMPNYDDEVLPSMPVTDPVTGSKQLKKIDYESLVVDKNDPTLSAPSTQSYYSTNSMMNLFQNKGANAGGDAYSGGQSAYKDSTKSLFGDKFGSQTFSMQSNPAIGSVGASAYGGGQSGPVTAAIQSIRSLEVKDIQDSYENHEPQVIDIPPSALPIVINFRTSSSAIQIHQSHETSEPAEVQSTQSEDEPHYLKHQVTKPVIQEVHEIILPYRKVIQEIRPVEEMVKTIIARGSKRDNGQYQQQQQQQQQAQQLPHGLQQVNLGGSDAGGGIGTRGYSGVAGSKSRGHSSKYNSHNQLAYSASNKVAKKHHHQHHHHHHKQTTMAPMVMMTTTMRPTTTLAPSMITTTTLNPKAKA